MARVNITIPDAIFEPARAARLNVSRIAAAALAEELDRRAKVSELDGYLTMLEAELGPVSDQEAAAAQQWADRVLGSEPAAPARRRARQA